MPRIDLTSIVDEAALIFVIAERLREMDPPATATGRFPRPVRGGRGIPVRGDPGTNGDPFAIYCAALRFWAMRTASQISLEDWHVLVDAVATQTGGRNVVGFFESRFADLELTCGGRVTP